MPPFSAKAGAFGVEAPVQRGFLARAGTGLLDLVDLPGNVVRSGVRFAQTGDTEFLANIAANLSPFHEAERISGEDITGGGFSGFLAELALDPLLFINSLGGLTRAGKAFSRILRIRAERRIAQIAGKADDVVAFDGELIKLKKVIDGERTAGIGSAKKRSVVELGLPFSKREGIHLGDAQKLKSRLTNLMPLGFLPSRETIVLKDSLTTLGFQLNTAVGSGKLNQVSRIEQKIKDVKDTLAGVKPTVTEFFHIDKQVQSMKQAGVDFFDHNLKNRLLEANERATKTGTSGELFELSTVTTKTLNTLRENAVESLRKIGIIEEAQINKRLILLTEGQKFRTPSASLTEKTRSVLKFDKTEKKLLERQAKQLEELTDPDEIAKVMSKMEDNLRAIKLRKESTLRQIDEFVKVNGNATIEELLFIDEVNNITRPMIENAQNLRIGITSLKNNVLSYFTRAPTQEFLELKRKNKKLYKLMYNQAKQRLGNAKRRSIHLELAIPSINREMKRVHGINYNIFTEDPIEALIQRKTKDITAVHKAAGTMRITELYAQEGIKGVSEADFLTQMGLTPKAIGDLPAIEPGRFIPKNIVNMAKRNSTLLQQGALDSENIIGFLSALDRINRPFKILLTSPFPAFHNRNMVGNIWLNMMGGVMDPRGLVEASKILHRRRLWIAGDLPNVAKTEVAFFKELATNRVTTGDQYSDLFKDIRGKDIKKVLGILDAEAPVPGIIDKFLGKTGIKFRLKDEGKLQKVLAATVPGLGQRQLGQFYEDTARLAHYMAKKKEGMLPFEAMRSVNKYLFDYSNLTRLEQKVARPTFLFYTWMRNNIPLQINTMLTKPRVAAVYRKLTNIGDGDIPNYLAERGAIRNPFGEEEEVFGSLGLPIEDINLFNIDSADPFFFDQLKRSSQKVIGTLNPALRIGLEVLTGEQAFSRRPLRTLDVKDLAKSVLPISRFFRVAEKIADPEDDLAFKYLNLISGIRTFKVSKLRGRKDKLQKQLLGTGKATRQGFLVLPKKEFRDDKEVKELLKKITETNKKLRTRRR